MARFTAAEYEIAFYEATRLVFQVTFECRGSDQVMVASLDDVEVLAISSRFDLQDIDQLIPEEFKPEGRDDDLVLQRLAIIRVLQQGDAAARSRVREEISSLTNIF